ncbi:MAG: hypothetical protein QXM37_05005 [Candidatus Bathyarchaeia archaeon]
MSAAGKAVKKLLKNSCKITKLNCLESLLRKVCMVTDGKLKKRREYMSNVEHCRNPWNGKCKNTDIGVFILYNGDRLPICKRCWSKIADTNIEWGEPTH